MTLDERLTTYITLIDEAKRYSPHALPLVAERTGHSIANIKDRLQILRKESK